MISNHADLEVALNSPTGTLWQTDERSFWHRLNDALDYFDPGAKKAFSVHQWEPWSSFGDGFKTTLITWDRTSIAVHLSAQLKEPVYFARAFVTAVATDFATRFFAEKTGSTLISLADRGRADALSFCSNYPGSILIPDADFFANIGYLHHRRSTNRGWIEWKDRQPTIMWRGTALGNVAEPTDAVDDWRWLPRAHLCQAADRISQRFSIDAKLTGVNDYFKSKYPQHIEALSRYFGQEIALSKFITYKHLIDIDGWSNSWMGLISKLLTGSTVLKVSSQLGFQQWFYKDLEPWVHYVPVKSDLSDLEAAAEFVLGNSRLAEEIGRNGRDFALSLTVNQAVVALGKGIHQFATRQNFGSEVGA